VERVNLRQAFHGEPDNEQEGLATRERGPDEVNIHIKGGTLILRVPNTVPDDQVISKEYMDQFLQLKLELEDGSELTVTVDVSNNLVDTQLVPAGERGRAHEG
jgi:hypothetical protein